MIHTPTSAATLLDSVLKELGTDIISGRIPAGQRFTLQDLCIRFGISRTVAREAMRALEQLNLVHASRRVGITVQEKNEWSVFDSAVINWRLETPQERESQLRSLLELRIAVEPSAARSAADAASSAARNTLLDLANTIHNLGSRGLGNSQEFLDTNAEFHALVLTSSGNEMFAALATTMTTTLIAYSKVELHTVHPNEESLTRHKNLAAAISAGNADSAEKVCREMFSNAQNSLISQLLCC